jgi:hypothetical protein
MKKLENFKFLPIDEKVVILEEEGKFICTVHSHGLKISLYGWEGTYVEVFRNGSNDKLVAVRVMEDRNRLHFYARQIDLKVLLNQSIVSVASICLATLEI